MKYIFLDNNIFIYTFENKSVDSSIESIELIKGSDCQLVMSLSILNEFAQSRSIEDALYLVRCMEDLTPIWIDDFVDVQRKEILAFVLTKFKRRDNVPAPSVYMGFSDLFDNKPISPEMYVKYCFEENNQNAARNVGEEHAAVLDALRDAQKDGDIDSDIECDVRERKIKSLFPREELIDEGLACDEIDKATTYCLSRSKELYKFCPSLNIERHIAEYRRRDPNRNAKTSDSEDYKIAISASPYVDFFVTGDGYLRSGLEYASKKINNLSTRYIATLSDLVPLI